MTVRTEAPALPPWSVDPAARDNPEPPLGDLFAAPARHWPDRVAIHDGDVSYTFAQLEEGAQAVAAWLAQRGVDAGDRVALLAEKRAIMPMLAVAVWKCGAVYAPLDAAEPAGRLRGLLARLRPKAVIALNDRPPVAPAEHWLGLEQLELILSRPPAPHATVTREPQQAAYIVFASGSAGAPRGAEISAASLFACFRRHNQVLRFTAESRGLSLSPFHVDVSLLDTILPLSLGAFAYQFRALPAGAVMRAVLRRERITHLIAVSMLLTMITGDGRQITQARMPSLETVLTGAQVCDPAVVSTWARQLPQTRVIHAFGPPEATIFSLSHEIGPADPGREAAYPIGRPLPGLPVKIMRDETEIRQPGVAGELWIGGDQVMRGYFDQPEETRRLIVERDGVRYFRTGDMCEYDEDGDIRFDRHDDEEVTWLAGRRTHLSEIRQAALSCPGIEQAVAAVVRRHQRDVVALVITARARPAVAVVAARLRDLLPDYMRPALLGWTPAQIGDRQLIARLTAAAHQSSSSYFALSAEGSVEPVDKEDQ